MMLPCSACGGDCTGNAGSAPCPGRVGARGETAMCFNCIVRLFRGGLGLYGHVPKDAPVGPAARQGVVGETCCRCGKTIGSDYGCASAGHDYQPRYDQQHSPFHSENHTLEQRYCGDRCTRCGDWKLRP